MGHRFRTRPFSRIERRAARQLRRGRASGPDSSLSPCAHAPRSPRTRGSGGGSSRSRSYPPRSAGSSYSSSTPSSRGRSSGGRRAAGEAAGRARDHPGRARREDRLEPAGDLRLRDRRRVPAHGRCRRDRPGPQGLRRRATWPQATAQGHKAPRRPRGPPTLEEVPAGPFPAREGPKGRHPARQFAGGGEQIEGPEVLAISARGSDFSQQSKTTSPGT